MRKAVSISLLAPNTGKKHAVQVISIISRISNRLRRRRERLAEILFPKAPKIVLGCQLLYEERVKHRFAL
jgi:hypothetical protein